MVLLFAILLSVIALVRTGYNLRNAQRTSIFKIQIEKSQEIVDELDLLVQEIYYIRSKVVPLSGYSKILGTETFMKDFHNMKGECSRLIKKNQVVLPNIIFEEFLVFDKYIHNQFFKSIIGNGDFDATYFLMKGNEFELSEKYEELIQVIRKEFHIDSLTKETFKLLKKSN